MKGDGRERQGEVQHEVCLPGGGDDEQARADDEHRGDDGEPPPDAVREVAEHRPEEDAEEGEQSDVETDAEAVHVQVLREVDRHEADEPEVGEGAGEIGECEADVDRVAEQSYGVGQPGELGLELVLLPGRSGQEPEHEERDGDGGHEAEERVEPPVVGQPEGEDEADAERPERLSRAGAGAVEGDGHAPAVREARAEHGDGRRVPERGGESAEGRQGDDRPDPRGEAGEHHEEGGEEEGEREYPVPVAAEPVRHVTDEEVGEAAAELLDDGDGGDAGCRELVLLDDEGEEDGESGDVPVLEPVADGDGGDVRGPGSAERTGALEC